MTLRSQPHREPLPPRSRVSCVPEASEMCVLQQSRGVGDVCSSAAVGDGGPAAWQVPLDCTSRRGCAVRLPSTPATWSCCALRPL